MKRRFALTLTTGLFAMCALGALTSAGCVAAGPREAVTKFLVSPKASGSFWGWSEITVPQDANSVGVTTLQFVRLEVDEDEADDLTFLQSLLAEAVTDAERVPVAKKEAMPEGETIVPLDILYDGDLRPLFPDGRTIRIEWTGSVDPSVQIPEIGVWISVRVRVNIH